MTPFNGQKPKHLSKHLIFNRKKPSRVIGSKKTNQTTEFKCLKTS